MGRKCIRVSAPLIEMLATAGNPIHAVCTEGLPDGARLVGVMEVISGADNDFTPRVFEFIFEHDEWPDIGHAVPVVEIQYTKITEHA